MSKETLGVAIGNATWRFVTLKHSPSGCYIIPRIGNTGLHLSIHPPNTMNPRPHVHLRSPKLQIDEDIEVDRDLLSRSYWKENIQSLMSLLMKGLNPTLTDNRVFMIPSTDQLFRTIGNNRFFNLDAILNGTFYNIEENKIPVLISKLNRINPLSSENTPIGVTEDKQLLFILDNGTILKFSYDEIAKHFFHPLLNVENNAFDKMLTQLQATMPTQPKDIFPPPFFKEVRGLKERKLKFTLLTDI